MLGMLLSKRTFMRVEGQKVDFDPLAPRKLSIDVRCPDLGTEGKNARRMSQSVVDFISSCESHYLNDNLKPPLKYALGFCRDE